MLTETRTANPARRESPTEHVWFWPVIVTAASLCLTRSTPVVAGVVEEPGVVVALVVVATEVEEPGPELARAVAEAKVEPVEARERVVEEAGAEHQQRARRMRITTTIQ